jgi:hypothetical protein
MDFSSLFGQLKSIVWWQALVLMFGTCAVTILINWSKRARPFGQRKCSDCIKIIISRIFKSHDDYMAIKNNILHEQLSYWEQISEDMISKLLDNYIESVRNSGKSLNNVEGIREYKFFNAILCIAFNKVKFEIKKSLIQDNYDDIDGFIDFCIGKNSYFTSKFREYISGAYDPITASEVSNVFSEILYQNINEIYSNAIKIKNSREVEMIGIEKSLNECILKETGTKTPIKLN